MNELDSVPKPKAGSLDYSSYLKVPELLELQQTLSVPVSHDEHLFILIHQSYELWFKQMLYELEYSFTMLQKMDSIGFTKVLSRIVVIQRVLNEKIDILETMTPTDFNLFRGRLRPASGFQSYQFRMFEILLGKKNKRYLSFFEHSPKIHAQLKDCFEKPTLYDHFLKFMSESGFDIPAEVLNRDYKEQYQGNSAVQDCILEVYNQETKHQLIYRMLELMLDLDEKISLWRYRHVLMVQRMIGQALGTGGSSGSKYLTSTLNEKFFTEIWAIRDRLSGQEY